MRLTRLYRCAVAVLGLVALAAGAAGCANNTISTPSDLVAYSQADLRVGTGADVIVGSVVTVNYTGWFYDASAADHRGVMFTTSLGQTTPLQITVGTGQVIQGWDQGLVGMKEGGLRRLVIPPSMGYGGVRYGVIPPYTTLVFDVEAVAVQ